MCVWASETRDEKGLGEKMSVGEKRQEKTGGEGIPIDRIGVSSETRERITMMILSSPFFSVDPSKICYPYMNEPSNLSDYLSIF